MPTPSQMKPVLLRTLPCGTPGYSPISIFYEPSQSDPFAGTIYCEVTASGGSRGQHLRRSVSLTLAIQIACDMPKYSAGSPLNTFDAYCTRIGREWAA